MKKVITPLLVALTLANPAAATEGKLELELNALASTENGCHVTFLAANRLATELTSIAFEIALFDTSGTIAQLVTLDFNGLPDNKTKVLQFELPNLDCANVGRILINDATSCDGEGLAVHSCLSRLETTTKTDIIFGT